MSADEFFNRDDMEKLEKELDDAKRLSLFKLEHILENHVILKNKNRKVVAK